jgi:elongation factor G
VSKGAAKTESSPAPQPRTPEDIRNVVLVGPGGAGKSTLFDHLVAARVPGRRPHEGERDRSVGLAVASFESNGLTINLVDAPGFPDFVGELRAGLVPPTRRSSSSRPPTTSTARPRCSGRSWPRSACRGPSP